MEARSWPAVTSQWRRERLLVPAELEILSGEVVSLDDVSVRRGLERELADLLLAMEAERLDIDVIQGKERKVTQAIARALFKAGAAGIAYRSKYDNELCLALFEGRARLVHRGEPRSLTDRCPEFDQVCREFDLSLEPVPAL
jgi:hypothetical protein